MKKSVLHVATVCVLNYCTSAMMSVVSTIQSYEPTEATDGMINAHCSNALLSDLIQSCHFIPTKAAS